MPAYILSRNLRRLAESDIVLPHPVAVVDYDDVEYGPAAMRYLHMTAGLEIASGKRIVPPSFNQFLAEKACHV